MSANNSKPKGAAPVVVLREEQYGETEKVGDKKEAFSVVDVDPAATEFDTDIQYMNERIADVSVPGSNNPNEAVGILDGDKTAQPVNLPAPGGFGGTGQG